MLHHLDELLLLLLDLALTLLVLQLDLLLSTQRRPLLLKLLFFFSFLLDLGGLYFLVVFLLLGLLHLSADTLGFQLVRLRQLKASHFVANLEDGFEYFKSIFVFLVSCADRNSSTQEHLVLVVHLLVRDVEVHQAVTMLLESIANCRVDQEVGGLVRLSEHD